MPDKTEQQDGAAGAEADASIADAAPEGSSGPPPTLREVLAPLESISESEQAYGCRMLLQCLRDMEAVRDALQSRKPPQEEELADQERILLTYLSGYYSGVTGTPGIIHGNLMEPELIASGIVAPFVEPRPDGAAGFGVPTRLSPDIRCDNRSELLRMAVAALISFYMYMNFRQGPGNMPPDEVVLIFTTITIHSTADAEHAAALDKELLELQGPEGFGCGQIRWLMHYIRSRVMGSMGDICYILGNKEKHAECYAAIQKDTQYMVKAEPRNPMGYSLYARQSMNFQGMGLAAALLSKGLTVAAEVKDNAYACAMSYQRAAALLLGGGGGEEFEAEELQQLLEQGELQREALLSWFPSQWRPMAVDGEPDRTLVTDKLVPEWEKRNGGALAEASGKVPALQGLLYVTKPPSSIPPGALRQLEAAGQGSSAQGGSEGGGDA